MAARDVAAARFARALQELNPSPKARTGAIKGLAMGLFSFLSGGKKKEDKAASVKAAARVVAKPAVVEKTPEIASAKAVAPPVSPTMTATGVAQARLRLKLAASLRAGQHQKAYEAATGLAEIQVKAGRPTVARVWKVQAERIKAGMAA